jgi:hypothetical protein
VSAQLGGREAAEEVRAMFDVWADATEEFFQALKNGAKVDGSVSWGGFGGGSPFDTFSNATGPVESYENGTIRGVRGTLSIEPPKYRGHFRETFLQIEKNGDGPAVVTVKDVASGRTREYNDGIGGPWWDNGTWITKSWPNDEEYIDVWLQYHFRILVPFRSWMTVFQGISDQVEGS